MITQFTKDPAAHLDYQFDWAPWLDGTDTITAHAATAEEGLDVESSSATDDTVTVWLSGGTTGSSYRVTCQITTADGRVDERMILVNVRER